MDTNMLPSVQLTKFESNFNHNLFQSSGITHWMSSGKWRESFQSLDDKNNLDALLYPLFTNVFSYFYGQNLTFSRIITKNIRTNIQHSNHFQWNFGWDEKSRKYHFKSTKLVKRYLMNLNLKLCMVTCNGHACILA